MRAALMLCAAVLAFAQQPPDPDRVLARAQASLAEAAAAVPKYTCTETVEDVYKRQVLQQGIEVVQDIAIPEETQTVRLIVFDRGSNAIGSVTMPLPPPQGKPN